MLLNHHEVEQVMMERAKDALREVEQDRLIQAVKGSRESQGRRLVTAILRILQTVVVPVLVPEPRRTDRLCWGTFSKAACSKPSSHTTECY